MGEIILTCPDVALSTALNDLAPPADAVMFLERVPEHWLSQAEITEGIRLSLYDDETDWSRWERGRVFCPRWELRWEQERSWYTGAPLNLPGFIPGPDLSACVRREASYYLWGKRVGDRFIELQVPRALTYPVAAGRRVKLRVAEWFDATGEKVAYRFLRLQEEE